MNRNNWKTYAFWIMGTEAMGALSGYLNREGTRIYTQSVIQPPLSPPGWVFPVVWSVLYLLMGIAAGRVWLGAKSAERSRGLIRYGIQLGLNFGWSFIFFGMQQYGFALLWLTVLWCVILGMIRCFGQTDLLASRILVPYAVWVAFAGYLNLGVWLLNPL